LNSGGLDAAVAQAVDPLYASGKREHGSREQMPLYEKRFWNRGYRGGGRNVYTLGINTDTWELQVRHMKFWRGQLKETSTHTVAFAS